MLKDAANWQKLTRSTFVWGKYPWLWENRRGDGLVCLSRLVPTVMIQSPLQLKRNQWSHRRRSVGDLIDFSKMIRIYIYIPFTSVCICVPVSKIKIWNHRGYADSIQWSLVQLVRITSAGPRRISSWNGRRGNELVPDTSASCARHHLWRHTRHLHSVDHIFR